MKFLRRTFAAIASIFTGRGRKVKAPEAKKSASTTDEVAGQV